MTRASRGFAGGSRELWFVDVERNGASVPLVLREETGTGAFSGTALSLEREAVVYRALQHTRVPIARLVGVAPGGEALLMQRLPGTSKLTDLRGIEAESVLESFIDALAALHGTDPRELDLPGFSRPEEARDHALDDLELWEAIAKGGLNRCEPLLAYAAAWLRAHAPSAVQRTVVVQGDTGPGNFMWDAGSVTGLVDWEFCHLGDPMDDIAWLDLRAGHGSGPFADVSRRDRLYEDATGLEVDPVAVRYYTVFVYFRCAVTTGITISRGGGAVGLAAYFAPHHRFLVQLGGALADAIGTEPSFLDLPVGTDTPSTRAYDRAIEGLTDDVVPVLPDATAKLRTRAALLMLEHARDVDRVGAELAAEDDADRRRTLGCPMTNAELADVAGGAGATGDRVILDLLFRTAQREKRCWDTPAAGGPSALRAPARVR